jgi:hypothetical protein
MHPSTSLLQFLFLILASTPILFTSAQYIVTNPSTGETWRAGEKVKIQWTLSGTPEDIVNVRLIHGKAENPLFDLDVCENVKATDGECEYTVSEQIKSGTDYSVVIGKDNIKYGHSNYCKYGMCQTNLYLQSGDRHENVFEQYIFSTFAPSSPIAS